MERKKMELTFSDKEDKRIIYLPEIFDVSVISYLKSELVRIIGETNSNIVIDMKKTTFIDSTGVGTIILILKILMKDKRQLFITNPEGIVRESLEMAKIFKFVTLL